MVMWAKGQQRLIAAGSGFLDISEAKKPVMIETGSTRVQGAVVYNTKLKKWIMMSTAGRPLSAAGPRPTGNTTKSCATRRSRTPATAESSSTT